MNSKKVFLWLFAIYICGFILHLITVGKAVYGDGVYYYSWLHSIAVDKNIDFKNEFERLGGTQPLLASGNPGNKYTVGPALLWLPPYLAAINIFQNTGFEFVYQLIIGLYTVILVVISLYILYSLLRKYYNTKISLFTTLSVALATNLLFYGSIDPINSHSMSFVVSTIFFYLVVAGPKNMWFIKGLFLGLIGLMRPQDLITGMILIPDIKFSNIKNLSFGTILGLLPQIIAWTILYGSPLASPYLTGEGFTNLINPKVFRVLFSHHMDYLYGHRF